MPVEKENAEANNRPMKITRRRLLGTGAAGRAGGRVIHPAAKLAARARAGTAGQKFIARYQTRRAADAGESVF